MPIELLVSIAAVSIIQSIFGVGILLFGTPILLLLGYSFVDALGVLLPISMSVNLLQIIRHHGDIDLGFYKNILIFSVPLVVLCLALVTSVKLNVTPLIGVLLIFVALKNFSTQIACWVQSIVKFERLYLLVMGIVHGLSNLGGSLLTIIIYSKHYHKDKTRVTAAASYMTVGFFQLLTLIWLDSQFTVSYFDRITLMQVGSLMFLLTEEMLYNNIDNEKYSKLFAVFLFISGCLLILKSL